MTFSALAAAASEEKTGPRPITTRMQPAAIQNLFCRMELPRFIKSREPKPETYEGGTTPVSSGGNDVSICKNLDRGETVSQLLFAGDSTSVRCSFAFCRVDE